MLCPFKQNIFVCRGGVTAPVLDSGICGLWRTPCYCSSTAVVASKLCLLVKRTEQLDSAIKIRKRDVF